LCGFLVKKALKNIFKKIKKFIDIFHIFYIIIFVQVILEYFGALAFVTSQEN